MGCFAYISACFFNAVYISLNISFPSYELSHKVNSRLLCPPVWAHSVVQGCCWVDCLIPFLLFLLKAKFQSQSWLWASEKPVHEGHGRSAVSPEPAHQNTKEVRGGCKRGRLLPVSISYVMVSILHSTAVVLRSVRAVHLVPQICARMCVWTGVPVL